MAACDNITELLSSQHQSRAQTTRLARKHIFRVRGVVWAGD